MVEGEVRWWWERRSGGGRGEVVEGEGQCKEAKGIYGGLSGSWSRWCWEGN